MAMRTPLKLLVIHQDGAAAIEYRLIAALIATVPIAGLITLNSRCNSIAIDVSSAG
jgi:Flp pilus assembly pilin Flp